MFDGTVAASFAGHERTQANIVSASIGVKSDALK
jgi:hypothetical protein